MKQNTTTIQSQKRLVEIEENPNKRKALPLSTHVNYSPEKRVKFNHGMMTNNDNNK